MHTNLSTITLVSLLAAFVGCGRSVDTLPADLRPDEARSTPHTLVPASPRLSLIEPTAEFTTGDEEPPAGAGSRGARPAEGSRQAIGDAITIASEAIQPHMTMTEQAVYVVFLHRGNIAVSVSKDGGKTFSSPSVAIDVQGRARGGAHRGPRIGIDARRRLTVTAPVTFDDAEYKRRYPTAELYFASSSDDGRSWSTPVQINEVSKKAPEALHWMAVAPTGEVHVAWLDMRSREQPGQDLYYARLVDGKVGRNEQVAATVCECCAPGMAVDAQGNPFLAFREGGDKPSREIFARYSSNRGLGFTQLVRVNRTETLEDG